MDRRYRTGSRLTGIGLPQAWTEEGLESMNDLELALAYARGIEGRMKPNPEAADSDSAMALLRYAAAIQAAEPEEPKQWKPEWFWNLVAKLALHVWRWKYRRMTQARVREWIETERLSAPVPTKRPYPTAAAHFSASSAPPLQPKNKKD
jgi:hypothetical protein